MNNLEDYKTDKQREFLLKLKLDNETEEEFWAKVPLGAWFINFDEPTQEDIEWGNRVAALYYSGKLKK